MFKIFRMTGVIGLTFLAIATVSSGCTPQAIDASGGNTEENTPSSIVTPDSTEEDIPGGFVTPGSAVENASGGFMAPGTSEEITDWWGNIKSTEPGAQYDDYFERQDLGGIIYFGIDSMNSVVKSRIEALRDSGRIVHLYGTLFSNVPDYNGSQIQVDRLEVEE